MFSIIPYLVKKRAPSHVKIAFLSWLPTHESKQFCVMTKCHSILQSIPEEGPEADQVNPEIVTWIGQCLQLDAECANPILESLLQGLSKAYDSALAGAYFNHTDRLIWMILDCSWPSSQTLGGNFLFTVMRDHVLTSLDKYDESHED